MVSQRGAVFVGVMDAHAPATSRTCKATCCGAAETTMVVSLLCISERAPVLCHPHALILNATLVQADVTELEDTCFSQHLRIQQLELEVSALFNSLRYITSS